MPRKFLVVVDDSPEFEAALRFACRRAKSTGGRVVMLRVLASHSDAHWSGAREEIAPTPEFALFDDRRHGAARIRYLRRKG